MPYSSYTKNEELHYPRGLCRRRVLLLIVWEQFSATTLYAVVAPSVATPAAPPTSPMPSPPHQALWKPTQRLHTDVPQAPGAWSVSARRAWTPPQSASA